MWTLRRVLGFVAAFIIIKIAFFIYNDYSRIQKESGVPEVVPSTTPQTQVEHNPAILNTSHETIDDFQTSKESKGIILDTKPGYHRYNVGSGISVAISDQWTLLSKNEIQDVKRKAGTLNDAPLNTPIAANSSPYENLNEGVFRVSIGENVGTADDIASISRANLDELCKNVNAGLHHTLPREGNTLTRDAYCSITTIGDKTALSIGYQRTDSKADGLWDVFIYQVPLEGKSAVITTSYKSGAPKKVTFQTLDMLHSIRWK